MRRTIPARTRKTGLSPLRNPRPSTPPIPGGASAIYSGNNGRWASPCREENMHSYAGVKPRSRALVFAALSTLALQWPLVQAAAAADPIKIGFSMGLTGANAPNGKQLLVAIEIWRDDVNAKGGLL